MEGKEKTDWSEVVDGNSEAFNLKGKEVPPLSAEDDWALHVALAQKMLARFGWRDWMAYYIYEDGSERPYHKKKIERVERD